MEGADQINASGCKQGVVCLDVRHLVDQEVLIKKTDTGYRTFNSDVLARAAVVQLLDQIGSSIINALPSDHKELYSRKAKRPVFIVTSDAVVVVTTEHGQVPTSLRCSRVFCLSEIFQAYPKNLDADLQLATWIAKS